jgi:transcription initiation factor TFIIE subunit alpha
MFGFEKVVIEEFGKSMFGNEGAEVLKYIIKNPGKTDEEIARKLKLKTNVVRKVLYELNRLGVLSFTKKDSYDKNEIKFFWFFEPATTYRVLVNRIINEIENYRKRRNQLISEQWFSCGKYAHPVMTFSEAIEYDFMCPVCGDVMNEYVPKEELENIDATIKSLEEKLDKIERYYKLYMKKNKRK